MKKSYETPVVEKIEFDYVESVRANSNGFAGGCGNGGGSGDTFDPFATSTLANGQVVYMQGHPGDPCQSSLAPDAGCGFSQAEARGRYHTDNPGYFC